MWYISVKSGIRAILQLPLKRLWVDATCLLGRSITVLATKPKTFNPKVGLMLEKRRKRWPKTTLSSYWSNTCILHVNASSCIIMVIIWHPPEWACIRWFLPEAYAITEVIEQAAYGLYGAGFLVDGIFQRGWVPNKGIPIWLRCKNTIIIT